MLTITTLSLMGLLLLLEEDMVMGFLELRLALFLLRKHAQKGELLFAPLGLVKDLYFFVARTGHSFVQITLELAFGGIVRILKNLERIILELDGHERGFLANIERQPHIPNLSLHNPIIIIIIDRNSGLATRFARFRRLRFWLLFAIQLL